MRKSAFRTILSAGIFAAILTSVPTASADPNLVSHWKFDEGSGSTAYDSAGDNDGTVNGATWTTGQIGSALHFDGSSAYVSVPDGDNSLDMDNEMTIMAWVKPNDNDDTYCIASKGMSIFGVNYVFDISSGLLQLFCNNLLGMPYSSASSVTAGVWQHVAVTLREGDSVKFYINGAPAGTLSQTEAFGSVNNDPLLIGKCLSQSGLFYGDIDDVRIYNKALSAKEISLIAQGEL
jgi:hypothetical protein